MAFFIPLQGLGFVILSLSKGVLFPTLPLHHFYCMSVRQDKIVLSVDIKGNTAQAQLNELRKKASDLTFELKGMTKGTAEWVAKSAEISKVDSEITEVRKQLGLTNLTMKELGASRRQLSAILGSKIPGSEDFKKYRVELEAVIARQKELKQQTQGFSSAVSTSFSSVKQNLAALAAGYLGFQAVITGLKSLVTGSIKLSDQLADLRRVAGLTKDEANDLNDALLKIDTRTSGEGLRNIAIIAGKLGVAKQDILSFTGAVDKLVVTLGDELGDADQITTELGKILNVFDGNVTGENISNLGNAIVEMANAGVASGGFITDFTQRVAGIAKASNLSLGSTVGLAAGFEELGLRSESSSTALQKLLSTIAGDLPKAAQIANVPLAEFNALFAANPQEALIKYAEGLTNNKNSFAEITSSFKDAGAEGARVVQTLQAIGQKGDFLRQKIDFSNEAIKRQTGLTEGFALKNENLAGTIEKLGKTWDRLIANNKITDFLKELVDGANTAVDAFQRLFLNGGAEEALIRAGKGLTIYMLEGAKAFKEFRKEKLALDEINSLPATPEAKKRLVGFDFGKNTLPQQTTGFESPTPSASGIKTISTDTAEAIGLIKKLQDAIAALDAAKPNLLTKKAIDENLAQRKKLQAELDSLEGKKSKTKSSGDPEFAQLKKDAAQFQKDLIKLKQDAELGDVAIDDREIKRIELKYAELIKRAKSYYDKGLTNLEDFEAQKKLLSGLQVGEANPVIAEQDYKKSLDASDKYFDDKRKIAARAHAEGSLDEKQYEDELSQIAKDSEANRLVVHEQYIGYAKSADANLVTAKEKSYQADLANFIKTEEQKAIEAAKAAKLAKELSEAEKRAGLQLNVSNSKPGSNTELEAKKALLNYEKDQEAKALQEKYNIQEEFWKAGNKLYDQLTQERLNGEADLEREYQIKKVEQYEQYANYFVSALSSLNQIISNKENKQLQEDRKINNEKKKNLKNQLDGKLVSKAQYDLKVQALDEEQAKKESAARKKQAQREKALAIFNAVINTAAAVVKTFVEMGGFPAGIPFAAAMAVIGGLQIAAIASAPLPEAGKGALLSEGPYHKDKDKGLHVVNPRTGKTELLLEKDEMVIKGSATRSNEQYTITGTPAQIGSKINSMHGGVSWATGARVETPKWRTAPAPQIKSSMARVMEQGGIIRSITGAPSFSEASTSAPDYTSLFQELIDTTHQGHAGVQSSLQNFNGRLRTSISLREIRAVEDKYERARKAGSMNQ